MCLKNWIKEQYEFSLLELWKYAISTGRFLFESCLLVLHLLQQNMACESFYADVYIKAWIKDFSSWQQVSKIILSCQIFSSITIEKSAFARHCWCLLVKVSTWLCTLQNTDRPVICFMFFIHQHSKSTLYFRKNFLRYTIKVPWKLVFNTKVFRASNFFWNFPLSALQDVFQPGIVTKVGEFFIFVYILIRVRKSCFSFFFIHTVVNNEYINTLVASLSCHSWHIRNVLTPLPLPLIRPYI